MTVMTPREIKIPSPAHPISIEQNRARVTVRAGGKVVATTTRALTVREAAYAPVQYIPRADVDMSLLQDTNHATYCPYKGECAYYSIGVGGEKSINAVWTYPNPYDAVSEIRDHVAFYPDRVDSIEESVATVNEA
jgi:uncharacterized protein (DUF427 family)